MARFADGVAGELRTAVLVVEGDVIVSFSAITLAIREATVHCAHETPILSEGHRAFIPWNQLSFHMPKAWQLDCLCRKHSSSA